MQTPSITIAVTQEVANATLDESRLRDAVSRALERQAVSHASIGVAIVDDEVIHRLNHQYLQHDYPTDVLSFPLSAAGEPLEGEIVVSVDTAAAEARRYGWSTDDELLLYVIHGALHLLGYDDQNTAAAAEMRQAESEVLAHFGLTPHNETGPADAAPAKQLEEAG